MEAKFPIKLVARRTGLTAHAIRMWEKRYGAVEPARSGANQRLYSDADVERLGLLRNLTQFGHTISQVATLPIEKLRQLCATSISSAPEEKRGTVGYLAECLNAVENLDAMALEQALKRAATNFGYQGVLQRVIAPLIERIGVSWLDGELTAAHEHFASATIRLFLGHAAKPFAAASHSPTLVVATPSGQLHEMGALLAAATAANLGWHVIYLGASLPAAEIAGAAALHPTRAVALSLVYPEDDSRLEFELAQLRELLARDIAIIIGGRAARAYQKALKRIGVTVVHDLPSFCATLEILRGPKRATALNRPGK